MTLENDFAEKALNTGGLAKYATEVADNRGISLERLQETLQKQEDSGKLIVKTFNKLESFKVDLKELFRRDAKGIIEYEDKDFEAIDKYIEANRGKNPELIADIVSKLEQVKEDQKVIDEKEAKIAMLTKEREQKVKEFVASKKEEYQEIIQKGDAAKYLNEKGKTRWRDLKNIGNWYEKGYWRENTAKAAIEAELASLPITGEQMALRSGVIISIDADRAVLEGEKAMIEQRYTKARTEILQDKAYAQGIHTAAQGKVTKRVNNMLGKTDKSIEDVDAEQAMLDRVNKLRDSNASFSYLDRADAINLQKQIDKEAEATADRLIDKAISEINLDANGEYMKLEQSLVKFIKKESLGSKSAAETKKFVLDNLKKKYEDKKKTSKAHALMLLHLISKVENASI